MTSNVTASLNGVELTDLAPSALIVDIARQLVGQRRSVFVEMPGRAGSWKFPEKPGDRRVSIELSLSAASFAERRAEVRAVAAWCDLDGPARLILSDEPDRYHDALLEDGAVFEQLAHGSGSLTFRVGPYALAITPSSTEITATGSGSDSGSFTGADELDALPVVEITPTDGTLTGFEFTLNGDAISYGDTIAAGDTVTISSISDTVTLGASGDTDLTGAFVAGLVAMGTVSGEFGRVIPEANDWALNWTGTATEITIAITWRDRYR